MKMINDLLSMSGRDGDSIDDHFRMTPDPHEIDQIFEAWSEERGRSIERLLLLVRVRRLLSRMLTADRPTDGDAREMKKLLRLIDSVETDSPPIKG